MAIKNAENDNRDIWVKYLWLLFDTLKTSAPEIHKQYFLIEATEDQIGQPGEEVTTTFPWPSFLEQPSFESSLGEEDILNWDITLQPPPKRPSGSVRVRLTYHGRNKPIPVDDPWLD